MHHQLPLPPLPPHLSPEEGLSPTRVWGWGSRSVPIRWCGGRSQSCLPSTTWTCSHSWSQQCPCPVSQPKDTQIGRYKTDRQTDIKQTDIHFHNGFSISNFNFTNDKPCTQAFLPQLVSYCSEEELGTRLMNGCWWGLYYWNTHPVHFHGRIGSKASRQNLSKK